MEAPCSKGVWRRWTGCEFNDNKWTALADNSSDLHLAHCIFRGNSGGDGGAVRVSGGSAELVGCTFTQNHGGEGGAVFLTYTGNLAIANCVFNANIANQAGGALSCQYDSIVTSHSSIFWGNVALRMAPRSDFRQSYDGTHPSSAMVSYNLIEGGKSGISLDSDCSLLWGLGNIDGSPCFVDPGYWDTNGTPEDPNDDFFVGGDYHLKSQAGRWGQASRRLGPGRRDQSLHRRGRSERSDRR